MVESSYEMREAVRQARLDVFGAYSARQPATPRAGTRRAKAALQGDAILRWAEPKVQDYNLRGFDAVQARDKWVAEGAARRLGGTTRAPRQRPIKRSVGDRILWQRGDGGGGGIARSSKDGAEGAEAAEDDEEKGDARPVSAEEVEDLEATVLAPLGIYMETMMAKGRQVDRRRAPGVRMPPVALDGSQVLRSTLALISGSRPDGATEALAMAGRGPDGKRLDGKETDDEWSDEKPADAEATTEPDAPAPADANATA